MNFHKPLILMLLIFASASGANAAGALSLQFEKPWIAEAPPVSKVMVAYMLIRNSGVKDIDIVKAESPLYSSIEFHETVQQAGMARMLRHDSIHIPANGSISLKRGAKHLMLFNPVKPLRAGADVDITFHTADGEQQTISVPVQKARY